MPEMKEDKHHMPSNGALHSPAWGQDLQKSARRLGSKDVRPPSLVCEGTIHRRAGNNRAVSEARQLLRPLGDSWPSLSSNSSSSSGAAKPAHTCKLLTFFSMACKLFLPCLPGLTTSPRFGPTMLNFSLY